MLFLCHAHLVPSLQKSDLDLDLDLDQPQLVHETKTSHQQNVLWLHLSDLALHTINNGTVTKIQ